MCIAKKFKAATWKLAITWKLESPERKHQSFWLGISGKIISSPGLRTLLWCLPNKFLSSSLHWQTPQRPIYRQLTQKHLDRLQAVGLLQALYNKVNWATVSWTVIVRSARFSQGSHSFLGLWWALLEATLTLSGHWGVVWCTEAIIYWMVPWRPPKS